MCCSVLAGSPDQVPGSNAKPMRAWPPGLRWWTDTASLSARKKFFSLRETMEIEDGSGVVATVRPAFFSPIRHRYNIDLADGSRLEAVGNFVDRDWELTDGGGQVIGRISRQWFRIRDTYGVEVEPGADDALVIAIAVCIDRIYEDEKRDREPGFGNFGGL